MQGLQTYCESDVDRQSSIVKNMNFLGTVHTIWQIFLHQNSRTTTNRSSPPSENRQIMRRSICLTFIGFWRCTKTHINIDSLRVYRSVRLSLYPLTKLLTHIKQSLQKYCETAYSRSGINQIWILKNSKELLDHLKSQNFKFITNIKPFDFSTPYTTIPHQNLKSRLATILRTSFVHKNGNRRYKYLVLVREWPYFVKKNSDSKSKYTEEDIIRMLEFLNHNILWSSQERFSGIPMGTNYTTHLADLFLYTYEAEYIQSLLSVGRKRIACQYIFIYRYIDDVLSINNPDFENYLRQMYLPELEIKD